MTKCQEEYRQAQIIEQAEKLAQAIKGEKALIGNTKECPYCSETIKINAKYVVSLVKILHRLSDDQQGGLSGLLGRILLKKRNGC